MMTNRTIAAFMLATLLTPFGLIAFTPEWRTEPPPPTPDAIRRAADAYNRRFAPAWAWMTADGLSIRPPAAASILLYPAAAYDGRRCNSASDDPKCRDADWRLLSAGQTLTVPTVYNRAVVVMQSANSQPWRFEFAWGGGSDVDMDGDNGTDADIAHFFAALGGSTTDNCADYDGDGDFGTDSDIERFWSVLGGGS